MLMYATAGLQGRLDVPVFECGALNKALWKFASPWLGRSFGFDLRTSNGLHVLDVAGAVQTEAMLSCSWLAQGIDSLWVLAESTT